MDFGKNISFIPKKPLTRKVERSNRPVSILLVVSYFVFFATIASYGGLYFYNKSLKNILTDKTAELEIERKKIDPSSAVEDGEKLQKRITNFKDLLDKHVAVSTVFDILEGVTLKSIVLQEFSLEKGGSVENGSFGRIDGAQTTNTTDFVIKIKGVAPSYGSLAYQSDVLKNEVKSGDRIKSFSIERPILDDSGNVSFELNITVDSNFLLYKKVLEQNKQLLQESSVTDSGTVDTIQQINGIDTQVSETDVIMDKTDKNVVAGDKDINKINTLEKRTSAPSIFEEFINFFKKYK